MLLPRALVPLVPFLIVGCQEYAFKGKDDSLPGSEDTQAHTGLPDTGDDACPTSPPPAVPIAATDACGFSVSGLAPIVEWAIPGIASVALPVVGDVDGDGMPDVVVISSGPGAEGRVQVYSGDGRRLLWRDAEQDVGAAGAPAIADIDGDGRPEVLLVVGYSRHDEAASEFGVQARDGATGVVEWASEHFHDEEMDDATGLIVSDLDHDGSPEVVAGRVVLRADGGTRAVGPAGSRGAVFHTGDVPEEGAFPAVADLDLDGEEEVITGNARWNADGVVLWSDPSAPDGAVSVANLDDDPEGEVLAVELDHIRAFDTDGALLWGPLTGESAHALSVPAVGDLDGDGSPEIVVGAGFELWALERDGSALWTRAVHDATGATGASLFDLDGDGAPEVLYEDEQQLLILDGADGSLKARSEDRSSQTLYDYPVVADVDGDGQAEILVANESEVGGLVVYGDLDGGWAPARQVWNQHSYSITNIQDDLSVPVDATPNFTVYNSYHSGIPGASASPLRADISGEILSVCADDCDGDVLRVWVRVDNASSVPTEAGLLLALYTRSEGSDTLLSTVRLDTIPAQTSSPGLEMVLSASSVGDALVLAVDDDGTGTGHLAECNELDNVSVISGPFCP